MRDRGIIYVGLLVFLTLVTSPIWFNLAAQTTSRGPEPALPRTEKACVAATDYMRTSHMSLLATWRDRVVREHVRTTSVAGGRTETMSLSRSCARCHDNKADFCDRCHTYAGVQPGCWDCHVDPALTRGAGR